LSTKEIVAEKPGLLHSEIPSTYWNK